MGKLFGTDGIRGVAGSELSPELAMKIGRAMAAVLSKTNAEKPLYVIGSDTRISKDMLECALAAGISSVGCDVLLLDVMPTPAVAYLTKKYEASAGLVVSASHNPAEYNGIKIFNHDGYKLPDEVEAEIESYILDEKKAAELAIAPGDGTGKIMRAESALFEYEDYIVDCVGGKISSDIKILVDCANGASYETAPQILSKLGANYDVVGCAPDGKNINLNCGSTYLSSLTKAVKDGGYDIGIAFDGDADRCLCVDENGEEIDGDRIVALLALHMKNSGKLAHDTAVVTVMSNLGFMRYMNEIGIRCATTAVGDRYVLEEMRDGGFSLGGEQSGHVILHDYSTTGDGQLTAALILKVMSNTNKTLSELAQVYEKYPQVIVNVRTTAAGKAFYKSDEYVEGFIEAEQQALMGDGRVLVRVSGTEPLIRVMVEGKDLDRITASADRISKKITERLAKICG